MENEYSNEPEEKTQENDVGSHVVDGECKPPDGEHCCEVAENKGSDGPEHTAVGQGGTDDFI